MSYRILLRSVKNTEMRDILVRRLSLKKNMDYDTCRRQIDEGEFVYAENILWSDVVEISRSLKRLGVTFSIIDEDAPDEGELVPPASDDREEGPEEPVPGQSRFRDPAPEGRPQAGVPHFDYSVHRPPKKESPVGELIAVIAFIGLLGVAIWFLGRFTDSPSSSKTSPSPAAQEKDAGKNTRPPSQSAGDNSSAPDGPVTTARQAEKAVDSAAGLCGTQGDAAVKLYHAAISFNRKNIDAWHGLLNCYRENGLYEKAAETRREMRAIFGEGVFSLHGIVQDFGALESLALKDNPARISYRSKQKNETDLRREVFRMLGRSRSSLAGRSVSVYAMQGRDRGGYLYTVDMNEFPRTFTAFSEMVQVTPVQ
ncbi:MAG: tetratricopeptide repeat protein [Fibrobacterota bacterium]